MLKKSLEKKRKRKGEKKDKNKLNKERTRLIVCLFYIKLLFFIAHGRPFFR